MRNQLIVEFLKIYYLDFIFKPTTRQSNNFIAKVKMKNGEYKGFECVSSFEFKGTPLHLYKSKNTGLQIGVAEVEGPLVNSFLAVSTEADSHDGCPHVLEVNINSSFPTNLFPAFNISWK